MKALFRPIALVGLLAAVPDARAVITVAPGYALRRIPTPDVVQGGVVRHGNAILVGQGTFGPGGERVMRLDGRVATTVAEGFGSFGGFDLDAAGTLYLTDNCYVGDFGCDAATTGDTLYAIPTALTRTTAATAASTNVLPAGAIPFAQDVLVVPGAVLVSDGVGPGAGRVVKVVGTTATDLVTGLDFAAGLALQGSTLLVGNSNFPSPASVKKYSLAGVSLGTLATGLSGVYGVVVDGGGKALVSGGFAGDFTSSVEAIDSGGAATERARGFGFTADLFYDAARDATLVLDFGVSEIASICGDANADGVCDVDCAAPVAFDGVRAKFGGVETPAGDDKLTLQADFTVGNPIIEPIANGLTAWLDDANLVVVADIALPAGAYDAGTRTGWRSNSAGTSWTFKHPTGIVGVTRASVRAVGGSSGTFRVKLKGKKSGYGLAGSVGPWRAGVALSPTQCATGAVACAASGNTRTCE
jgi:hypothetical protein